MRRLSILLLILVGACGSRPYQWQLPNGYTVFAANSTEVYVANAQRELLLGPSLKSVGISGDLIVVFCGWEPTVANGFRNTVGYSVLDTRTGQLVTGLNEQQANAEMRLRGQNMPELVAWQRDLRPSR